LQKRAALNPRKSCRCSAFDTLIYDQAFCSIGGRDRFCTRRSSFGGRNQHAHPERCCRRSSLILPGRAAFSASRSLRACARAASASSTASCQARMFNLKLARFPTCSSLPSRLYLLSQRSLSSILANNCGSSIATALQSIAKFCLSGRLSSCRI
jgi:hypothetical protein